MQIFVSPSAVAQLYSARLTILVHRSLRNLLPEGLEPDCSIQVFNGDTIGEPNSLKVPLNATRLPTSVGLIIAPEKDTLAEKFCGLLVDAGHPTLPEVLTVRRWQMLPHRHVYTHIVRLMARSLGARVRSTIRLEQGASSLRQELARRDASLDRLGGMLHMFGLRNEELAIDALSTEKLQSLSLPVSQGIGRSLHNLRRISIYKTSPAPGRIEVAISIAGKSEFSTTLEAMEGTGWLDLVLPEGLILSVQNAELDLRSVLGEVEVAGDPTENAAVLRFWWNEGIAQDEAGAGVQIMPAPPPSHLSVSKSENFVTVSRGLWLQPGTVVAITAICPSMQKPLSVALALVPHGTTSVTTEGEPKSLSRNSAQLLSVISANRAERFDLVLKTPGSAKFTGNIEWSTLSLDSPTASSYNAYASARFASLHSAIDYCDGPLEEQRLNSEMGFPVVMASDGNAYMQTHPVEGRIVGARLDSIVPLGTRRLWVDIANAHPMADTMEFILAVRRAAPVGLTEDWIRGLNLMPYKDLAISEGDDNDLIVRVQMPAGSNRALDITLPGPLSFQGHLYCLVDCTSRSNRYGWCRWNTVGFAIDTQQAPPLLDQ